MLGILAAGDLEEEQLAARGFDVPGSVRDQVLSCTDLARLDQWAETAVTAASLKDVFRNDQ